MTTQDFAHSTTLDFAGMMAVGPGTAPLPELADVLPNALVTALTDGPGTLYAVLDAAKVPFLVERLTQLGLTGRMIYKSRRVVRGPEEGDDPMAAVSPWLIALPGDGPLLRDMFCADDAAQWPLMAQRAGILLHSALAPDALLAHLRALSVLHDESGVNTFFRFQEPGMLMALCAAVPADATATVTDGIARVIWAEDTVIDGRWRGHIMVPTPTSSDRMVPIIDRDVRQAFARVINYRRARLILRESDVAPADRAALIDDLAHLLSVSQSSSDAMLHHLRLRAAAPAADRDHWRQMVDERAISLAFINRRMHQRYCPDEVFAK